MKPLSATNKKAAISKFERYFSKANQLRMEQHDFITSMFYNRKALEVFFVTLLGSKAKKRNRKMTMLDIFYDEQVQMKILMTNMKVAHEQRLNKRFLLDLLGTCNLIITNDFIPQDKVNRAFRKMSIIAQWFKEL